MSDQANETPLLELLRAIPLDAVGTYEHSRVHHSSIPYGYYAHAAADQIESLKRENEGLQTMLGQLNDAGAASITPEMRERIERKLADMQAESPLPIGGELVDLLRDLLGEQG